MKCSYETGPAPAAKIRLKTKKAKVHEGDLCLMTVTAVNGTKTLMDAEATAALNE